MISALKQALPDRSIYSVIGPKRTFNPLKLMTTLNVKDLVLMALEGDISLAEATHFLSVNSSLLPDEAALIHTVVHFLTDQDLRKRDSEYDKLMRKSILASLNTLP